MAIHHVTEAAENFTCNAYLATGDRPTLVDAGTFDGVVDTISKHTDDLEAVVLTHQHGDHIGELEGICAAFDPEVYAYADHPLRTHSPKDGDTLDIGDESFEVVFTPGHADDHISLVSETTLFSGDVVVYNDGAFEDGSFGRTDRPGQSREQLIESIGRLLEATPETVETLYAGHGDVFHGDVREVLERAQERAERREPKYPE